MQFTRILVASLVIGGMMSAASPAEARREWDRYHRRYVDVGSRRWHYGPRGDIIFGTAVAAGIATVVTPRPVVVAPTVVTPVGGYAVYDYDPFYTNTTYVFRNRGGYRYYYDRRGRVVGRVGTTYIGRGRRGGRWHR
jgi:hypothetical protein